MNKPVIPGQRPGETPMDAQNRRSRELMSGKTARELAEEGAQRAVDHANAVEEDWGDRAFKHFRAYALANTQFMTEDVRVHAYANGLPHAPDGRAWGAVTMRAKRERIVAVDHYANTRIKPAHATPRPVFRSLIMGGIVN